MEDISQLDVAGLSIIRLLILIDKLFALVALSEFNHVVKTLYFYLKRLDRQLKDVFGSPLCFVFRRGQGSKFQADGVVLIIHVARENAPRQCLLHLFHTFFNYF